MARKHYNRHILKFSAGILLLIVSLMGLRYSALLRGMDRAAEDYNRGDMESALRRYDDVERQLRSFWGIRLIPGEDRRILFLDEARSLYALGRYDDAFQRLDQENQFSAMIMDSRFSLLRGDITFRQAMRNGGAAKGDSEVLEDAISAAEGDLRESLRQETNNWDAKYNFEYINYMRKQLEKDQKQGLKLLPQIPDKENQTKSLSPKQKT